MKMADGGFRPAYNVQFATDVAGRAIVGVQVTNEGTDRGQLPPLLADVVRRTGIHPGEYLVDGGFMNGDAITHATARGITVFCPEEQTRGARAPGTPVRGDTPAVVAWRARIAPWPTCSSADCPRSTRGPFGLPSLTTCSG